MVGADPQGFSRFQSLHHTPGRARLRVPGLYRAQTLKERLEEALAGCSGVQRADANVLTGNILILFDPTTRELTDILVVIDGVLGGDGRVVSPGPAAAPRGETRRPDRAAPESPASEAKPRRQPSSLAGLWKLLFARPEANAAAGHAAGPAQAQSGIPWHTLSAEEVQERLEAVENGLVPAEAGRRLALYGPNALPEPPRRSELSMFLGQFVSIPVALLAASAAISVATGGILDALVILGVVVINAGIGYYTESQAERTIRALTMPIQITATLVRDGQLVNLPAEEVVPGDLMVLAPGVTPAADGRLIAAQRLSVDESALSGESLPVRKQTAPFDSADLPLADRSNMIYRGTTVTGGSGLAVVVATGVNTEIGRIQLLAGEAKPPETPMQRQLDQIGTQMVVLSAGICGLVFVLGMVRGHGLLQMLKTAISLAVAAVPEGLPTVATTTLALGIRDMGRHKVAIRHLDAVEALGAVQTICFDKTGTITENRMKVVVARAADAPYRSERGVLIACGDASDPAADPTLRRMLEVAALCNECEVEAGFDGPEIKGSPTEAALVRFAAETGVEVVTLRATHPARETHHRAEGRNYMSTLHTLSDGRTLIAVKGSPGEVLQLCTHRFVEGEIRILDDGERRDLLQENERLAGQALRVLGFAFAEREGAFAGGDDPAARCGGMVWLGIIGMEDPMRDGMPVLVSQFHEAGVKTIMITGDQSTTAYAIGHKLNLSGDDGLQILDSAKLDEMDPEVLTALSQQVHVFSRVSPAHKLKIVQSLQRAGLVVAMTGDGVNDGPALRAADIGVAMGARGTDTARGMSDVVLEDDNLHTMITAIGKGRSIYDNIRKSLRFLLATNMTEIEIVFGLMAVGMVEPLTPMQLLWINLISDIFPGLALALEPPEPDVLRRPPRDPKEPILAWPHFRRLGLESAVISGGALAAFGYGVSRYGAGPQANTLLFSSLVGGQLLHSLVCRSPTHGLFSGEKLPPNKYLTVALGGSLALQVAANMVPALRGFLRLAPLGPVDLAVAAGGAIAPFFINELIKVGYAPPPRALPEPEIDEKLEPEEKI